MNKIFEKLNEIENISSYKEKEKILFEILSNNIGEEFIRLIFSEDKYNISLKIIQKALKTNEKVENPIKLAFKFANGTEELNINLIKNIINNIKNLSGNKLIYYLNEIYNKYNKLSSKYITSIFLHNLYNGVSLKTVNKILKKLNKKEIERFGVQLCGVVKKIEDWNKFPIFVGVKYDGFRCIIEKKGNEIKLISRQGKLVNQSFPELVRNFKLYNFDFTLDGEIMAKDFNEIQHRIGRKESNLIETEGLHFRAFDILYLKNNDLTNLNQFNRSVILRDNFEEDKYLKFEEFYIVYNKEQLIELYNNIINKGHEGIVIKYIDNNYIKNSRDNWFKVKPIYEMSVKIIDYEYGNGRNLNEISSLKVTDLSGLLESKVGSGITDKNKEELKELLNKNKLINTIIDIEYGEIMKNKNKFTLRFPRFIKIRYDKNEADDINNKI